MDKPDLFVADDKIDFVDLEQRKEHKMSNIKQLAIKAMTTWSGCRDDNGNLDEATCHQARLEEISLFNAIAENETALSVAHERIAELTRKNEELTRAAAATEDAREIVQALRKACGFVEDGSHTTVKICQDDATKEWLVYVGKKHLWSETFSGVLGKLMEEVKNGNH